eukprot:scaffold2.g7116.t1
MAAPPSAWADLGRPRPSAQVAPAAGTGDVGELSASWKHIRNVVAHDARTPDLFELLSHSVRETQYSFQAQGWPPLLRPLSPVVAEMPAMVMERYQACQTVAFCGAFPSIGRAWASVDNSLFLWRFDKWQDVPLEYSGEEQAIVTVGLATPRPGVFVEAIQHLLVLATATEVVLLGVCCSPGTSGAAGGPGDGCEQLVLQPLPLYSAPTDNVTMVSVASSASGRIFLGGADGNLYELQYGASDSWRSKRCSLVCNSGGLRRLLPSFLPSLLFGSPSALVELLVFDMGHDGSAAPNKVAEATDFLADASRATVGRDVFGRGSGDRRGAAVVAMAVIPPSESTRLHLLTVTSDGRRVYWGTTAVPRIVGGGWGAPAAHGGAHGDVRPDRLRADVARQAMPSHSAGAAAGGLARGGLSAGAMSHGPARVLEVAAALYSRGVLLLAEGGAAAGGRTRVFMLSRDLTIPPVGTATGAHVAVQGLREAVTELEMVLPGEATTLAPLPQHLPLLLGGAAAGPRDELTAQNVAPPPRFLAATTGGLAQLEKLRPVDVLAQLLEARDGAQLELFFKSHGAAEAAAMCILLATTGPPAFSAAAVAQAKAALDNPQLCGEPELREAEAGAAPAPAPYREASPGSLSAGFDMGAPVPVAEPEWSGAHWGMCLYASRLLAGVWDEPVVTPLKGSPQLVRARLPTEALQALEERLRALDAFLAGYIQRRAARRPSAAYAPTAGSGGAGAALDGGFGQQAAKRQRLEDAQQAELRRAAGVRALVARAAESAFLLRVLVEHNIGRLAARMEESLRQQLRSLRFREWVSSEEGEAMATQLISVAVGEHLAAAGGVAEDLAAALQSGAPSYFKEEDKLYYQASGLLQRAEAAAAAADRETLTSEAVGLLLRVVPQLAYLRAVGPLVELPLRKAAALDPRGTAAGAGPEAEAARQRRQEACYAHALAVLGCLLDRTATTPALEALNRSLSDSERALFRQQLLARAAAADDALWHEALYSTLLDAGAVRELLALDTPHLEGWLVRAGGLAGAAGGGARVGPLSPRQARCAEVLARFYIRQGRGVGLVYELLAERAGGAGEGAVTLEQRLGAYQQAVLQARILSLQQRLADQLAAGGGGPEAASREDIEAAVSGELFAHLRREPKELAELYNDYAVPAQTWQQRWEAGEAGGDPAGARAAAALDAACLVAESLGERFFPNEASFPAPHVALRLEQAAAGSWPHATGVEQGSGRVVRAMVGACRGSYDAAVRAYGALLAVRGGDPQSEELHAPALRLRLLRALALAISAARDKLLDAAPGAALGAGLRGGRREVGALAAACEAYASEARRLPQEGAPIVRQSTSRQPDAASVRPLIRAPPCGMSFAQAFEGARLELARLPPAQRLARIAVYARVIAAELVGTLAAVPFGIRAQALHRSLPDPGGAGGARGSSVSIMRGVRYAGAPRCLLDIYLPPDGPASSDEQQQQAQQPGSDGTAGAPSGSAAAGAGPKPADAAGVPVTGILTAIMTYSLYPQALVPQMTSERALAASGAARGSAAPAGAGQGQADSGAAPALAQPPATTAAADVRMPAQLVAIAGVFDLEKHFAYEQGRDVHELSTMQRAAGGVHNFPAQSPAVILARALDRRGLLQADHTSWELLDAARAEADAGAGSGSQEVEAAASGAAGASPRSVRLHGEGPAHRIGFGRRADGPQSRHAAAAAAAVATTVAHAPATAAVLDSGAPPSAGSGEEDALLSRMKVEAVRRLPPVTLMSSCTDVTVPFVESAEMYWLLHDCGVPAKHLVYTRVSHGDFVTCWRPLPQLGAATAGTANDLPGHASDLVAVARGAVPGC